MDGKTGTTRSWRHWTRRLRKLFSRNRQVVYPINSYPRLVLPKVNLKHKYDMSHEKRGLAIIFNHKIFDGHMGHSTRTGTEVDLEKLIKTCQMLEFSVKSYDDLKRFEIFRKLEKSKWSLN